MDPPSTLVDPTVVDVAIDRPGRGAYSYRVPAHLALELGDCVEVDFAGARLRGFVIARDVAPPANVRLKDIIGLRTGVRLPGHLLALIRWGARYWRCSLGEFLAAAVPEPVRAGTAMDPVIVVRKLPDSGARLTPRQRAAWSALPDAELTRAEACAVAACGPGVLERLAAAGMVVIERQSQVVEVRMGAAPEDHAPNAEQRAAISEVAAALEARRHQTFLLSGVTGSGKTLVYLELALKAIAAGRQVLMLVPEIALTPQLAARVRLRVARVALWHSGFTDGERAALWRASASGAVDLVLGTRSALFAPLARPGLIILDEEHEQTYKQESVPRYHARDLAVVYGTQLGVPVVLGSATPSLESIHNVNQGRYRQLSLRARPAGSSMPTAVVVDMRQEYREAHARVPLARELVARLGACRARGEQAIVLLNRRGWSPLVSCRSCGEAITCRNCAITMTWHRADDRLRCHYCGAERTMPAACPTCGADELTTQGIGTEQLAQAVSMSVPSMRVLRVDADTVATRQGHAKAFASFARGEADCLVGTQMVAKGHDFPRVTLVGVVDADRGLALPDFRASERTFQLLSQVSGRAGRAERPGHVVVQAFDVHAAPLVAALAHRPLDFIGPELDLRRRYGYPPFGALVRVVWSGRAHDAVGAVAAQQGERIAGVLNGAVLLGPNPPTLTLLKGMHRMHAIIKASSRGAVQALLDRLAAAGGLPSARGVRVAVDVDPYHIS